MGIKSHYLACLGFSASEEHLLTKAQTRLKRRSEKKDFSETLTDKNITTIWHINTEVTKDKHTNFE